MAIDSRGNLESSGSANRRRRSRRKKKGYSWIKYLLIALAVLLLLLLLGSALLRFLNNRKFSIDFSVLRSDGQLTVTKFQEKLLFIYPYLPDSYEDMTRAEITVTNLNKSKETYSSSDIEMGDYVMVCYILEEGTYTVELVWSNGVTAEAVVYVGEQSLYELVFSHI